MKLKKINKVLKKLGLRLIVISRESEENTDKRPEIDILLVRLKTFIEMIKTLRKHEKQ